MKKHQLTNSKFGTNSDEPIREDFFSGGAAVKLSDEAEFYLAAIVESSNDSIVTIDLEGAITSWNRAAERLYGYPAREAIGKPLMMLALPEDLAEVFSNIEKIKQSRKVEIYDAVRVHKDGHQLHLEIVISPVKDAQDKIIGVSTIARDVTERRIAEEAVRESEERLRASVKNLPGGAVFIVDKDLRYLVAEGEALAEAGFASADFIGKTIFEALPPEVAIDYEPRFRAGLAGEAFEHEHEAHDCTFVSRGVPLKNGNGEIYAVLAISYDITQRKLTEKALAESEEQYRTLFESIDEGFCIIEVLFDEKDKPFDWEFCVVNPAFEKNNGLANAKNKTIRELAPDIEPKWFEIYGRIAKTGEPLRFEEYSAALNRWFRLYAFRVGEPSENCVAVVFSDITRRKQYEKKLRVSEERYGLATQAVKAVIYDWNITDDVIFRSPELENLLGFSPDETAIQTNAWWKSRVHPEDAKRAISLVREKINSNATRFEDEYRIQHRAGHYVWVSDIGVFLRDEQHKAVRCVGSVTNVTKRKEAEETLRQSEERLRLLIESAEDYAIFTMTTDGIIDSWNTGAEKTFGWTEREAVGLSCKIIFTPEDRKKGAPELEMITALKNGRAPDERFHLRKDGTRFYVSGMMMLLKDATGKASGLVKIARDMSEQINADKIRHDKEMLQKLVGAQEDERRRIARDLHDELGQQLTALRLNLEKVRRMCEDEAVCAEIGKIELLAKSVDNGVDFLAWELRPAALDQLGLVAALANYVEQWTHYSGVTAEFLASSLKRKRFAREVETNLYRIAQEAMNNINKHAKAKSVEVLLEKRGDLIVLIIQDDGKGFNVANKKTRSKGIGLIGMHERAGLIGGTLEIESAPGKGTTIFVRVPV